MRTLARIHTTFLCRLILPLLPPPFQPLNQSHPHPLLLLIFLPALWDKRGRGKAGVPGRKSLIFGWGCIRGPRHEIFDFGMGFSRGPRAKTFFLPALWDNRGRGKAGVPIFDGAWGRKCPMRDALCPSLDIFAPSPFVPEFFRKAYSVGLRSVPICPG